MTPGLGANGDNLEIFFFDLLDINGMLKVHIRIASMRQFLCIYTKYNFMIK